MAWWETAIHKATPLSKVPMPSRIWRMTAATTARAGQRLRRRQAGAARIAAMAATAKAS